MALLQIEDLAIEIVQQGEGLRVVDGVTFSLNAGEIVCLVGESGSGKSLTALSIARLHPVSKIRFPEGRILLNGQSLLDAPEEVLRKVRGGKVSYIFQEPSVYLHPVTRVGDQILEALRLHRPEKAHWAHVVKLLEEVNISDPAERARSYPHQLSGGMQQRVMIAMALASEPQLLVADEPTTALDVTIQAEILSLLTRLKRERQMAVLFITHNLGVVRQIADRILVMYAGQVVESAPTESFFAQPRHPYSQMLLKAVPRLSQVGVLQGIPGQVPRPAQYPAGCRFHPRCPHALASCQATRPGWVEEGSHQFRCPVIPLTS